MSTKAHDLFIHKFREFYRTLNLSNYFLLARIQLVKPNTGDSLTTIIHPTVTGFCLKGSRLGGEGNASVP